MAVSGDGTVREDSAMRTTVKLPSVSFGATSAIVTSMGLISGFGAAGISRPTIVAGLLIVGLADNLTDSLSIHIYQESEKLEQRAAFRATVGNFAIRLLISLSFITLVIRLSIRDLVAASLLWGLLLLAGLTWFIARSRHANVLTEILKHLGVAAAVIAASHATGAFIDTFVH
jgi:hypothetical protein